MTTSLRPQVLAGRTLLLAGRLPAGLAAELGRRGAVLRTADLTEPPAPPHPGRPEGDAADLLLVGVPTGAIGGVPASPVPAGSLADPVSEAFTVLRDHYPGLAAVSGAALCLLHPAPLDSGRAAPPAPAAEAAAAAVRTALTSLVRSLAQEWAATGIRVNGAVAREPVPADRLADLVAVLAGPAGVMMTGQLIELQPTPEHGDVR